MWRINVVAMANQKLNVGTIVVVVVLIAIMIGALWFAASAWTEVSGPPMPPVGYAASKLCIRSRPTAVKNHSASNSCASVNSR